MAVFIWPPKATNAVNFADKTLVGEIIDLGNGSGPGVVNSEFDTIPRSSNNAIAITGALTADVKEILFIHNFGEFLAIYRDAARTQKICNVPLTPDVPVPVSIPAGVTIYLGHLFDTDIGPTGDPNTASKMLINLLG